MNSLAKELQKKYQNFISELNSQKGMGPKGKFLFSILIKALWFFPLLFLCVLLTPVGYIILKLLEPFVILRFGRLPFLKIGEMTRRCDLYLRRQELYGKPKKEVHVFFCGQPANRQMLTLIKRRLLVIPNRFLLVVYKMFRSLTPQSKTWIEHLSSGQFAFKEFNRSFRNFAFNEKERQTGSQEMKAMGIEPGIPFICIHARCKAYHDKAFTFHSRDYWSYHDFRDSDIRTYLPAAEYLTSLGYYVIRMGQYVDTPLSSKNSRIIDYSTKYRSDFMDAFLPAHCRFFLATNSGLFCISQAFDIPVASANWIPIKFQILGRNDLLIPKKLWSNEKKRCLTFQEIVEGGIDSWVWADQYQRAGIEMVNNTAEEILDLAQEMNARLGGTWVTTDEDEELQRRFREILQPGHLFKDMRCRMGAKFLRQNQELLEIKKMAHH